MIRLIVAASLADNGTYGGEVALTVYDANGVVERTTRQRVTGVQAATRFEAERLVEGWIVANLFPIVKRLPLAKS